MSRETSTRRQVLKLGSGALVTALAGCGAPLSSRSQSQEGAAPSAQATPAPEGQESTDGSVYTEVYRDTIDSVVLVKTPEGQGTGFVFDETHVVTNAHVVGGAAATQLRFNDGTWSRGEIRGTDPHSDLAVIQADSVPSGARPLPFLGEPPTIGQEVVAIGNPFNLDGTVTTGIISGTDRLIPAPTGFEIPDAIQTDAAVNPGNSGGPLMSLDSRVVGVVNSKRGDNIAFGISAALTQRVVPQLIETGEYDHAYMGVSLESVTPTVAEANGMADPRGLLVVRTAPGGPAAGVFQESELRVSNGMRVPVGGDVILAIEETPMQSFEDLASYLALETRPGDTVEVSVLRDGTEQTIEMTLASRPERSRSPLR